MNKTKISSDRAHRVTYVADKNLRKKINPKP